MLRCKELNQIVVAMAIRMHVFNASSRWPLPRGKIWGAGHVWWDLWNFRICWCCVVKNVDEARLHALI